MPLQLMIFWVVPGQWRHPFVSGILMILLLDGCVLSLQLFCSVLDLLVMRASLVLSAFGHHYPDSCYPVSIYVKVLPGIFRQSILDTLPLLNLVTD